MTDHIDNTNTVDPTAMKTLRRTLRTAAESAHRAQAPVQTTIRLNGHETIVIVFPGLRPDDNGPSRYNAVELGVNGKKLSWDEGRKTIAEALGLTYKPRSSGGGGRSNAKVLTPEQLAAFFGTDNPPMVSLTDTDETIDTEALLAAMAQADQKVADNEDEAEPEAVPATGKPSRHNRK